MSKRLTTLPRLDGFAMPAEWSRQAQVWMAWPERPDNWRRAAAPAQAAFAAVANTIAEHEAVSLLVSAAQYNNARTVLDTRIRLIETSTNDAWLRDTAPTFVRSAAGEVRAIDWVFNAWGGLDGGLYHPWDADDAVAGKIAEIERLDCYRAPLVMEGGALHVDGEGTCLVTEECLLNPNRNPTLTRGGIERHLRDYLGVDTVLWLGRGILNDETDGHVDNLCCFLRPGVVALAWTDDQQDPQYPRSLDALQRLEAARDARGRALEVIKLPVPRSPVLMGADAASEVLATPGTLVRPAGFRLAASYVNFLLCNDALILPAFDDPHDALARDLLAEQFPGRVIRQVPGREILYGGGNVHCITQQQPA